MRLIQSQISRCWEMAEIQYEIFQDWHLPAVYELERKLFKGEEWSLDQFKSELAFVPASRMYWVAKLDGAVIGYAGVMVVDDFADVATLAVVPELRGRGIGTHFMNLIFQEAARRGAERILLEVRKTNLNAISLYQKLGFEILAERPNYYGPGLDAYMMELAHIPEVQNG